MRKLLTLLFAGFLFVSLAACGDDDGGEETSSADTTADDDSGGGGDLQGSDFCEQADTIANDESLDQLDFENPDDVETGINLLEDWRDNAPDEVKDDIDRMIDAFRALVEAGDDPDALQELSDEFEDIDEVSARIETFVQEECDVDLSNDGTDDGSDSTDTTDAEEEAGDPTDPPDIDDDDLAQLAEDCHDGSGSACDQLFFGAEVGSPEEEYGNTCGGRFDESPGLCATAIGD